MKNCNELFSMLNKEKIDSEKYLDIVTKIYEENEEFLEPIAQNFVEDYIPYEDVLQEASLALLSAIKAFKTFGKKDFDCFAKSIINMHLTSFVKEQKESRGEVVSMYDHVIRTRNNKTQDLLVRDIMDETERTDLYGGKNII